MLDTVVGAILKQNDCNTAEWRTQMVSLKIEGQAMFKKELNIKWGGKYIGAEPRF